MADRTPGATLGWVAASLGCILLALSLVTAGGAFLMSDADDSESSLVALRLSTARADLEVATLDVVVGRLLLAMGEPGADQARVESAAAAMRDAVSELEQVRRTDGATGWASRQLLDAIDVEALHDPVRGELGELFDVADDARYLAVDDETAPSVSAFFELSFVEALPWHILIEALAGMVDVSAIEIADADAAFVARMVEVVRTEGGWLAEDPPTPLADSQWFEIDQARTRLPRATERAEAAFAGSELVGVDRWALELGTGSTAPPVSPARAVELADELHAQLAPIVDAAGDATMSTVSAGSADGGAGSWALIVLSGALATGAVVLLSLGVRDIRAASRHANERAELAVRDALTGVGNRHLLAELERSLADDSRLDRHVVAIVDLDRFKMINDVHGHAGGDAVLVALAERLRAVADDVASTVRPSEHAVIRLGGDEFLIAIHTAQRVNVARLLGGLDLSRSMVIEFEGETIPLDFSIGIAESAGRCRLDELMRAADLAVYEDKAARAAGRQFAAPTESGTRHHRGSTSVSR